MIDFKRLAEPFPACDVEWRVGQAADDGSWCKVLAYITNRAIMQRLDDVCGPENWRNEYQFVTGGVLCGISIRTDDGWVTKWDGANLTDVEPFKGVLSDSMKRTGVQWGIGRYLYNLEEGWGQIVPKGTKGAHYAKAKNGTAYHWLAPVLPAWAMPKNGKPSTPTSAFKDYLVAEVKAAYKTYEVVPTESGVSAALGISLEMARDVFNAEGNLALRRFSEPELVQLLYFVQHGAKLPGNVEQSVEAVKKGYADSIAEKAKVAA